MGISKRSSLGYNGDTMTPPNLPADGAPTSEQHDSHSADPDSSPEKAWTTGRITVSLIMLSVVIFWAWALGPFGPRDNPDSLDDVTYSPAAISICSSAISQLDGLEPAAAAVDPADRADTLSEANVILTTMVEELTALVDPTGTDRDALILDKWLSDWDIYLGDRDDHVQRLLTEGDVPFEVSRVERTSVTGRVDWFANANQMQECGVPLDL